MRAHDADDFAPKRRLGHWCRKRPSLIRPLALNRFVRPERSRSLDPSPLPVALPRDGPTAHRPSLKPNRRQPRAQISHPLGPSSPILPRPEFRDDRAGAWERRFARICRPSVSRHSFVAFAIIIWHFRSRYNRYPERPSTEPFPLGAFGRRLSHPFPTGVIMAGAQAPPFSS